VTSTDLTLTGQPSTDLTIDPTQTTFTDPQVAALRHIGVENAGPGDLAVFFHVCKRTALDPFARQIHMIGRNSLNQRTKQWEVKQTIQTGIDGYRLIARRAADARREAISVDPPQWAHKDGDWRDVWASGWGVPIAARITVKRAGEPFTAVALFDEYKQTKKDGNLTSMWAQRPAGQLAKCAEALALRMAFPQDLSGVYVEEEMHQADSERPEAAPPSGPDRVRAALHPEAPAEDVQDAEVVETKVDAWEPDPDATPEPLTDRTRKQMFAELTKRGITDAATQRVGMSKTLGREIKSRADLTEDDGRTVVLDLMGRPVPEGEATP